MHNRFITISLRPALAYAALSVILPSFIYGIGQQILRQSANDPQIQIAEDTAAALNQGQSPDSLVDVPTIDMRASLAPFVMITDASHHFLAGTGRLNGQPVLPPAGVFEAANHGSRINSPAGENRVTWQPAADAREAAVVVPYHGGYVLAARNLREVEVRSGRLLGYTAGAIGLLGALGLLLCLNIPGRKRLS